MGGRRVKQAVIQHLLGEKHKVLILDQAECSSRISRQPLPQACILLKYVLQDMYRKNML
ncbi:hypothetical protein K402DRAFT_393049 [Aulographum hederae CBS 113979]|uniref:Uncharacterized protein n=1 Tax=Aulographum hederae CBS 113979 TaxID=1176131 RepID=A0A6G1H2U7_9PEZI|nr:hypothetical protein K402DRAFT_393049 [Aulographum hederae CBS 113979]